MLHFYTILQYRHVYKFVSHDSGRWLKMRQQARVVRSTMPRRSHFLVSSLFYFCENAARRLARPINHNLMVHARLARRAPDSHWRPVRVSSEETKEGCTGASVHTLPFFSRICRGSLAIRLDKKNQRNLSWIIFSLLSTWVVTCDVVTTRTQNKERVELLPWAYHRQV